MGPSQPKLDFETQLDFALMSGLQVALGDILISEGTGKIRQDENHANNAAQAAELDLLLQSESLLSSRGCVNIYFPIWQVTSS